MWIQFILVKSETFSTTEVPIYPIEWRLCDLFYCPEMTGVN